MRKKQLFYAFQELDLQHVLERLWPETCVLEIDSHGYLLEVQGTTVTVDLYGYEESIVVRLGAHSVRAYWRPMVTRRRPFIASAKKLKERRILRKIEDLGKIRAAFARERCTTLYRHDPLGGARTFRVSIDRILPITAEASPCRRPMAHRLELRGDWAASAGEGWRAALFGRELAPLLAPVTDHDPSSLFHGPSTESLPPLHFADVATLRAWCIDMAQPLFAGSSLLVPCNDPDADGPDA